MNRKVDLKVDFVGVGEKARCAPDPRYPYGLDVDLSNGSGITCVVRLKYPAPEIGFHRIECLICGLRTALSAAGRADDPRQITLSCLAPLNPKNRQ